MKVTCLKTCNRTSNRKRLQKSFCLQSYVSFQSFYLYLHFWAIMHKETFLVCYYTRALQNAAFNSADLGLVLMTKKRVPKIKILCTLNKSKYELKCLKFNRVFLHFLHKYLACLVIFESLSTYSITNVYLLLCRVETVNKHFETKIWKSIRDKRGSPLEIWKHLSKNSQRA